MTTQTSTRTSLRAAASVDPAEAFRHAVKLHQQGQWQAAEEAYVGLLEHAPGHTQAIYLRGLLARQTGRPALAMTCLERYLAIQPDDAQAIAILGLVCHDLKDWERSEALLRAAIAARPGEAHLHYNLGKVCLDQNKLDEAVDAQNDAIRLDPANADAHLCKGMALKAAGHLEAALASIEQAIILAPVRADGHLAFGDLMRDLDEFEAAIDAYEAVLILKPDCIEAAINCGNSCRDIDRIDDALRHYNHALALDPYHPEANYNKSLALLADGQLARGWALYEWRKRSTHTVDRLLGNSLLQKAPDWDGKPLDGRLLVIAEQGLGDQIFYAGMLADLTTLASSVTVCAEARLLPLLQRSFPGLHFIAPDVLAAAGAFDAQTYMGSLGRFLRKDNASLAAIRSPYLQADPLRTAALRERLAADGKLVCGLSWDSMNAVHGKNKRLPLDAMSQFIALPHIEAVDLQYGDTSAERAAFRQSHHKAIHKLDDIDNTQDIDGLAALISACDIVVTVSNTTAHLAAALGKPVLVMLPQASATFWYWHRHDECSPWYPTVRLFRKDEAGDWETVIDAVTLTLAGLG